jgi:hypothetical protein
MEEVQMKRSLKTMVAAIAATLTFALPASAGAKTGDVLWRCDPDGSGTEQEEVTFVSAPAAAEHGITQADRKAGTIAFEGVGGELCRVVVVVGP